MKTFWAVRVYPEGGEAFDLAFYKRHSRAIRDKRMTMSDEEVEELGQKLGRAVQFRVVSRQFVDGDWEG